MSSDFFRSFLIRFIDDGLHNYLLEHTEYNYKDLYYENFEDRILQNESIADFLLANKFFCNKNELSLEQLIAEYILNIKDDKVLIFDNFQNCGTESYGRILKLMQALSSNNVDMPLTIIFILSETIGKKFESLNSLCDKTIMLSGLESKYIEAIIKDFFGDHSINCKDIAQYFFEKYKGNPGSILALLKLNFNNSIKKIYSQDEILINITSPQNLKLDPTEKRIVLFLSILPFSISEEKMLNFITNDKNFINLDSVESIHVKICELKEREIIKFNSEILSMDEALKITFRSLSSSDLASVYMIYNLQKNFCKVLNFRENSDCLYFIINSQKIECTKSMKEDFFYYSTQVAISMAKEGIWEKSVSYFTRVMPYREMFAEDALIYMYKAFYFNSTFYEIRDFINSINDIDFMSFDYWYWKGNLLYMLNDEQSIVILDKSISYSKNAKERLRAQIIRKQAMSELPQVCNNTLIYYKSLIEEYKNADFPELAILYRNSLVVGGEETINLCNIGQEIAERYNQMEELTKIKHNKHFELFRMGEYEGCFEAFENSANFFQRINSRIYESAYGYNNLALFCLIKGNLEDAKLYSYSALIYADTPYSQITTHVNYNLIASICEKNTFEQEKRIQKIVHLLQRYKINDHRIFRKTFFSITISYIQTNQIDKARETLVKSEPYLQSGRHINRYFNLCNILNITPKVFPEEIIDENNGYYNFYSNPEYELWLLAYGHI
ncbi:MAG: hypothetical protein J1F31_06785 [Erysipelotrichales bacterium]|nr:hypothetical protein [Erysipelotrichales bacterium]